MKKLENRQREPTKKECVVSTFGDVTKEGLWWCTQCCKWHGVNHGHAMNHCCHMGTFGKRRKMRRLKGEIVERTN